MSAQIAVVGLVNLKDAAKGSVIKVSAADLETYPGYYKPKADHEAEQARAAAAPHESSSERHMRMRAELRADADRAALIAAELRLKQIEADKQLALAAKTEADKLLQASEQARRLAEVEAENKRLREALAERDRAEAKIIELRPEQTKEPAPEAPAASPAQAADKSTPPHQRKRDQ
jgi:hypothetical protein